MESPLLLQSRKKCFDLFLFLMVLTMNSSSIVFAMLKDLFQDFNRNVYGDMYEYLYPSMNIHVCSPRGHRSMSSVVLSHSPHCFFFFQMESLSTKS